jgi:uncharacterized protein
VAVRRLLAVLATAVLVLLCSSAAGGGARPSGGVPGLLLDGVRFHPELALTSAQRSRGLMHRPRAPADGMLFVSPEDTTSGFWMQDTLVPLTIVFFDRTGARVRRFSMEPCRRDPCRLYSPNRRYRFALELPAGDRRAAKRLGPLAALLRLSRSAS